MGNSCGVLWAAEPLYGYDWAGKTDGAGAANVDERKEEGAGE